MGPRGLILLSCMLTAWLRLDVMDAGIAQGPPSPDVIVKILKEKLASIEG